MHVPVIPLFDKILRLTTNIKSKPKSDTKHWWISKKSSHFWVDKNFVLNQHSTAIVATKTYFRICSYPVGGFTIIIAFLYPLSEPFTLHRIMPVLSTSKTTRKGSHLQVYLHCISTTYLSKINIQGYMLLYFRLALSLLFINSLFRN